MNRIFHFPYLSTSRPAGILKIADVNRKIAERIPAWNSDALKFLTTNIAYTGPRKPSPRDEKEISVIIVLIDIFCNRVPSLGRRALVWHDINV
jgi:hypothetical protein